MICPSCNRGMLEINREVQLDPEFKLTKWMQCEECGIGCIINAEFFYLPRTEEE